MRENMGFVENMRNMVIMVSVDTLDITEAAIVFLRILRNNQEHLFFIEHPRWLLSALI